MKIVPVAHDGLTALLPLIAGSRSLPLAHVPGAAQEDLARLQQDTLAVKLARGGAVGLGAFQDKSAAGLAVLDPLAWDSALYGERMGRVAALYAASGAEEEALHAALLANLLREAVERGYRCADLHLHVSDLAAVHAACRLGFRLMTTHVILGWDLRAPLPVAPNAPAELRDATEADVEGLMSVAAAAAPPYSRFLVDRQLPTERGRELFRQWAANSVRGYADRVVLACMDGVAVGYITWRIHPSAPASLGVRLANLDLTGVLPRARRQRVLTTLIHHGLDWLRSRGIDYAEVHTHALNTGMQRAATSTGARTLSARYCLHWHANT